VEGTKVMLKVQVQEIGGFEVVAGGLGNPVKFYILKIGLTTYHATCRYLQSRHDRHDTRYHT
jgi:hypothetical protein